MQLILVSGLSGSGKSIALHVLEDGGFYCVDNLPAGSLDPVLGYLAEAGHERVAVSVDARSAALAALPEQIARLRARGVDVRVLFLEATTAALLRRFSETRRRHPLASAPAPRCRRRSSRSAPCSPAWRRSATASTPASCCRACCRTGSATCSASARARLTLLFESFAYRDGIPLDADWVLDARMLPNPHYEPAAAPVHRARRARWSSTSRADPAVGRWLEDVRGLLGRWLPEIVQREPQLRHRRDRLHRRPPPLGVPGRAARRSVPPATGACWCATAGSRARRPSDGRDLPLFPLNTVLFPGGRLPLRIFEQRYMDMAKACLKDGSPFGVCLIREGAEVGAPAVPAEVGTLARITHWDMPQLGVLKSSRSARSASASRAARRGDGPRARRRRAARCRRRTPASPSTARAA